MRKMPYRLSVCGKLEIDNFSDKEVTHLLSLEDPDTPQETPPWFTGEHLQLLFHDVESLDEVKMLQAIPPTKADVEEILRLGSRCQQEARTAPVHLLVHCYAGISRSPAACFALVAQAFGPGPAKAALDYVKQLRPEAFPNLLITKYADLLLGRKGEMVRALAPLRAAYNQMIEEWFKTATGDTPT